MNYGFVKVAAATPEIIVADTEHNSNEIINVAKTAFEKGVRLVVFPELCVTGYTCGDLFLQQKLREGALKALAEIAVNTADLDMLICVGAPLVCGGVMYNCAVMMHGGKIIGIVPKSNIPDYGEFMEKRWFRPRKDTDPKTIILPEIGEVPFGCDIVFSCKDMPEFSVGIEICEDIWTTHSPSDSLSENGALIICNLSASNEIVGKANFRRQLVAAQSAKTIGGYIYSDAGEGESTTDLVFAGHDIIAENGRIIAESKPFSESKLIDDKLLISEIDVGMLAAERIRVNSFEPENSYRNIVFDLKPMPTKLTRAYERTPFVPNDPKEFADCCETVLNIQTHGLAKRMSHTKSKGMVVGISGGLDSCLALLVAVRAADMLKMSRKSVTAVTMPCFGTTVRTRGNAEILCERLGVDFECIDIKAAVNQHFSDIGHDKDNYNAVYENSQARERTQILMDIANAKGSLVVGTGDLSELALGWATYNGDHMSMYGVNASVPKTLVRHIVSYCADLTDDIKLREVLKDIVGTPVSPELLPADSNGDIAQKTEDLVGPYELHDFFLYRFIRYGSTPEKIEHLANYVFADEYDPETIKKWLNTFMRRFFTQQFKRSCLPDGPKTGSVGLSPRGDWRMPSDASFALWN